MSKSDIKKRRIAACLAVCEGEEFTIERLESGAFHLRSLVDSAFCSSQAHAETMGKLMKMTERKDELLAAMEQAGEKMVAADIDGALEIIKNAVAKERQG